MKGYELICRPYVTLRDGRRIYAKSYGKKAFCFWVKKRPSKRAK